MRRIEADQIVAQQEHRALDELVQACQRLGKITALVQERFPGIATHRGKTVDASALLADLKIDRNATWRERLLYRFARRVLCSAFYLADPQIPLYRFRLADTQQELGIEAALELEFLREPASLGPRAPQSVRSSIRRQRVAFTP